MRLALIPVFVLCGCGKVSSEEAADAGAIDAPQDGGAPVVSLADLRATADGPVDAIVEDVVVTYARANGFFIQLDPRGPALQVFTADDGHDLAAGNRVTLRVTSLSTFSGTKQIDGHEVIANDNGNLDVVGTLAQNLGTGLVPTEDLESELVILEIASISQIPAPDTFVVNYADGNGNMLQANMFYPATGLENCATGDSLVVTRAVITEFMGQHQIFADGPGDIAPAVDNCVGP